ncbi:MAG TPA: hypothetical protein DHW42_05115 [Candidatus Marinimicrobia bacterium]|nr:hypothetical protein [Candidatus Neomarinimicrobiota bacterium]
MVVKMNDLKLVDNCDEIFVDLVEILTEEVNLYGQLSKLLKNKQDAIVIGDVEKLRSCLQDEQPITQDALMLADRRKDCVASLSQIYKMDESELKLKIIINIAPPKYSIKLMNLKYRIKDNLDLITKINRENSYLLNFSIKHVKGLVNIFLMTDEESSKIYDMDGIVSSPEKEYKMLNFQI